MCEGVHQSVCDDIFYMRAAYEDLLLGPPKYLVYFRLNLGMFLVTYLLIRYFHQSVAANQCNFAKWECNICVYLCCGFQYVYLQRKVVLSYSNTNLWSHSRLVCFISTHAPFNTPFTEIPQYGHKEDLSLCWLFHLEPENSVFFHSILASWPPSCVLSNMPVGQRYCFLNNNGGWSI